MHVIECTPTRGQSVYRFGGAAPAMRVKPRVALRLWSDDAFGGIRADLRAGALSLRIA